MSAALQPLSSTLSEIVAVSDLPAADQAALIALNNRHELETSFLTPDDWSAMISEAFMAVSIGNGIGLLITFDQDAGYGSPNFLWFRKRLKRFVYVDRIIVDEGGRGKGYARQLYEALFETARAAGHGLVTCEVNLDPPNPGSDAFHARMGFELVGQAELAGKGKTVRYLQKTLNTRSG